MKPCDQPWCDLSLDSNPINTLILVSPTNKKRSTNGLLGHSFTAFDVEHQKHTDFPIFCQSRGHTMVMTNIPNYSATNTSRAFSLLPNATRYSNRHLHP